MVNALYYASLTQDIEQLRELIKAVHQQYDMDILEVLDPDGTLVLRVHAEGLELPEEPRNRAPARCLQRGRSGTVQAGLANFLGKLTILVVTPVRLQDNIVGYLVGAYLLDDHFASRIKEMGGVEVAFLGDNGVVGASHPDFRGHEPCTVGQ